MKKSLLFFLLFLLSCSRFLIKSISTDKLENSNDFNDILTLKYIRYSDSLLKYNDYSSSNYFAKLAMDSNNRKNKISFKIDEYMKHQDPNTLADVYFLFNCWLYFETNNKNLGEASICKDAFNKLITTIDKKRKESLKDKIVIDNNKKQKFLTREEEMNFINFSKNKTIDLYFDYDSYKLNKECIVKISAILKYLNSLENDYKITIIGHADRIGKAIYNNTLARRRANTVYNALNKNGVPKTLLSIDSVSSKNPQIITRKDEKMQPNRRVEIIINLDYKNQDVIPQPYF